MVHEIGHGLTAILLGGEFYELHIFENGSGVAMYRFVDLITGRSVGQALIALGGLLGLP